MSYSERKDGLNYCLKLTDNNDFGVEFNYDTPNKVFSINTTGSPDDFIGGTCRLSVDSDRDMLLQLKYFIDSIVGQA